MMARNPKTVRTRLIAAAAAALALGVLAACGDEAQEQSGPQTSDAQGLGEAEVEAFVDRVMKARQAGLPADEFLSADAQDAYGEHETGLWLHDDSLPGGPGGEYERFSVEADADADAGEPDWQTEVRIRVVWHGDAPPGEIVELLTIGAGPDGGLVVLDATRTDDPSDDGLPSAVAQTRQAIYLAAVGHDYKALRSLLDPATFSYSFGESGDPIGYWREQEEAEIPLLGDVLTVVLHSRFGKTEDIFMWPSAAAKEPSEWTEADLEGMRKAGSTEEEIRSFEQYGGYTGWRAGIRADGTWLFFIAGD